MTANDTVSMSTCDCSASAPFIRLSYSAAVWESAASVITAWLGSFSAIWTERLESRFVGKIVKKIECGRVSLSHASSGRAAHAGDVLDPVCEIETV